VTKKKENNTFLLVGLGNPGKKYEETRHNIGFTFINSIAKKASINIDKSKFSSLCARYESGENYFLLSKPQTFMNESGKAVREIKNYYKIPIDKTIIVFDDLDLNVGQIRIKRGGGSGGHNGIKSIIEELSEDTFIRIRIGIGKPAKKTDVDQYVLSKFNQNEVSTIKEIIDISDEIIDDIVFKGIAFAMNKFNSKIQ
tara:strand:+ start:405 stop:998 length:594 start_codon:yes stop_codon:yes gene_type:complete